MKAYEGKVALVTGGGKGIGRCIALALAARGVRLLVTGRDERALGETVGEIAYGGGKARHLVGDVRDAGHLGAAVDRALEVFGGLDIVVANAGQWDRLDLGGDPATAEAMLSTNLMGVYQTFNAALQRMRGPGRLIVTNIRPKWGRPEIGAPGYVACYASNAGIIGLVRATAHEVEQKKITCNAIVPRGQAQPEEVAELVVFLCCTAAGAITGQVISIGSATANNS